MQGTDSDLAEREGRELDSEDYFDDTDACMATQDAHSITTDFLPEAPSSDGWLLIAVVNRRLDTCNAYLRESI